MPQYRPVLVRKGVCYGLRTNRIHAEMNHTGGATPPLAQEMTQFIRFKPFLGFDEMVRRNVKRLRTQLTRQGCYRSFREKRDSASRVRKRPSFKGNCDGTFTTTKCQHESCVSTFLHKERFEEQLKDNRYQYELDLRVTTDNALEQLLKLVRRVKPEYSTDIEPQKIMQGARTKVADFAYSGKYVPLFAVELKYPNIKLLKATLENTGEGVASYYNTLYNEKRAILASNPDKFNLDALEKSVMQTAYQGLATMKGLSTLYTHNQALFMRTIPVGDSAAVEVEVSKIYQCDISDRTASAWEAMFGFMLYAEEDAEDLDNLIEARGGKTPHSLGQGGPAEKETAETATSQTQTRKKDKDIPLSEEGADQLKRFSRIPRSIHSDVMTSLILANRANLPNRFAHMSDEDQVSFLKELKSDEVLTLNLLEMEVLFLRHYLRVIWTGSSGTLVGAEIGGIVLVIKKWDRDENWRIMTEDKSLARLQNEVKVYKYIAEKHPELLGDVVPRVFAIEVEPEEETTLVMEYVGDQVTINWTAYHKKNEVNWYLDKEPLTQKDVDQINAAATRALNKLGKCGIRHSDRTISNLRVQRVTDETGQPNWHVWVLDFGAAELDEGTDFSGKEWILKAEDVLY